MACAGSNTQRPIDFLETIFGDVEEPDLEDLETAATQALRKQVVTAEKTNIEASEGPIPAEEITQIIIKSLPVPMEQELEANMQPVTDSMWGPSKKGPKRKVTHFFYVMI